MKDRSRLLLALLAAAAVFAPLAAPASAASNPVIKDCVAHGTLTKAYSIGQLNQALGALSPATREYTNCQDVINRALASGVSGKGGGGTGSGGSGSFLPTPVIIVLVVLALAAVTFAAIAIRRRGQNTAG